MSETTVTGAVRLSWPRLTKLEQRPGTQRATVSTAVLIPKTDTDTLSKLEAAIKAAVDERWPAGAPAGIRMPLKDGDQRASQYPEQAGHMVMNVSSNRLVPVVGRDNLPLSPEQMASEVYGGQNARVAVGAYSYDRNGNRGVSFGLRMVQILGGGDAFGGGAPDPASVFGGPLPSTASQPAAPAAPAQPAATGGWSDLL